MQTSCLKTVRDAYLSMQTSCLKTVRDTYLSVQIRCLKTARDTYLSMQTSCLKTVRDTYLSVQIRCLKTASSGVFRNYTRGWTYKGDLGTYVWSFRSLVPTSHYVLNRFKS